MIILLTFGITYLLNEKYQNLERYSLILSFSIIMTLFIIYNLFKYMKDLKDYKKKVKKNKKELLQLLKTLIITKEEFGKNKILANKFIKSRIRHHILLLKNILIMYSHISKII